MTNARLVVVLLVSFIALSIGNYFFYNHEVSRVGAVITAAENGTLQPQPTDSVDFVTVERALATRVYHGAVIREAILSVLAILGIIFLYLRR